MAYLNGKNILFSPKVNISVVHDLWAMVTGDGTRTDYTRAFYGCDYSGVTFSKPVAPTGSIQQCFDTYKGTSLPKNLDFSNAQLSNGNLTNMCANAKNLTEVYDLKLPIPTAKHFYTFYYCSSLVKIENLRSGEETVWEKSFYCCYELRDINIIGTIGQNGFDIHYSTKLSKASIISILNACNKADAGVTIKLPLICTELNNALGINSTTPLETVLVSGTIDIELTDAWTAAHLNGYTIAFE